jgi:hypothetical protein
MPGDAHGDRISGERAMKTEVQAGFLFFLLL